MASTGSRDQGGKQSVVLMVVAFITMGGFLYWLNVRAQPAEVAIVEVSTSDSLAATALTVQAPVFGSDPTRQMGRLIRIENLTVAGNVGAEAFWINVPNSQDPYLVHMDSAVVADSVMVAPGDRVTVIGNVLEMSDSVADAWQEAGAISENQKFAVTFATTFLEIMDLLLVRGGGGADGAGGAN